MKLMTQVREGLSDVTAPTLLIYGDADQIVDKANGPFVLDRLASSDKRLLPLSDSSHEVTLDVDRERVMVEVYDFIRDAQQRVGVHRCAIWGVRMNLEKVVFGFFVLLAATLNFGFFIGDLGDPALRRSSGATRAMWPPTGSRGRPRPVSCPCPAARCWPIWSRSCLLVNRDRVLPSRLSRGAP